MNILKLLKQLAKKRGNYYGMSKDSLPNELIPYLLDFEERQWIKSTVMIEGV